MSGLAVHHIAIAARDPVALAEFYEGLFGFKRVRDPRIAAASVWLRFSTGGDDSGADAPILMLEQANAAANFSGPASSRDSKRLSVDRSDFAAKAPGLHLLAFRIAPERRADWLERLREAGVAIEGESPHTIYIRDPEGNRVGLSHFPHGPAGTKPGRIDPDS